MLLIQPERGKLYGMICYWLFSYYGFIKVQHPMAVGGNLRC